jgi:GTP-dependent phosphoenolpyruvate carboxykinase
MKAEYRRALLPQKMLYRPFDLLQYIGIKTRDYIIKILELGEKTPDSTYHISDTFYKNKNCGIMYILYKYVTIFTNRVIYDIYCFRIILSQKSLRSK